MYNAPKLMLPAVSSPHTTVQQLGHTVIVQEGYSSWEVSAGGLQTPNQ